MPVQSINVLTTPSLSAIIATVLASTACVGATSAMAEEKQSDRLFMMMAAPHVVNGLSVMSTMKIARLMNSLNAEAVGDEVSAQNEAQGRQPGLEKLETPTETLLSSQDRHHTAYVIARVNDHIDSSKPENH